MGSISGERRRWLLYPALLSLGAGLLASCAAERPPPPQTSAVRLLPPPPETPAAHGAAPRPARKPAPPPTSIDGPGLSGEPTESAGGPENSSPPSALAGLSPSAGRQGQIPSQAELIGLDQSGAMRLLGPATEKSDEPPATVWHYKTGTCELNLFFYLDLRSGSMRTLHYSFKDDGADLARRQECLRSLIAAQGG